VGGRAFSAGRHPDRRRIEHRPFRRCELAVQLRTKATATRHGPGRWHPDYWRTVERACLAPSCRAVEAGRDDPHQGHATGAGFLHHGHAGPVLRPELPPSAGKATAASPEGKHQGHGPIDGWPAGLASSLARPSRTGTRARRPVHAPYRSVQGNGHAANCRHGLPGSNPSTASEHRHRGKPSWPTGLPIHPGQPASLLEFS
jgi:hypothetical protein